MASRRATTRPNPFTSDHHLRHLLSGLRLMSYGMNPPLIPPSFLRKMISRRTHLSPRHLPSTIRPKHINLVLHHP